ncbi:MAG: MGMT family protein [Patescibacteria group bacterium]
MILSGIRAVRLVSKNRTITAQEVIIAEAMVKTTNDFTARVLGVVKKIPRGQTRTYAEVARLAGNSKAYRAVGNILHSYDATKITVPCHRVLKSDGTLGGYRWGLKKKLALLKKEGVKIENSSISRS